MSKSTADKDELSSLRQTLREMGFPDAAEGKEIYNYFGNRVLEHTTSTGAVLAVKVKPPNAMDRSEADMMQYAATNSILAPKVRGVYDIITKKPIARVMVSERVPGVPLADVWLTLSAADQSAIKTQLRAQLARMRACTQPFIGRVGRQHTRNVYDRLHQTYCGPFADEAEFDKWCLARVAGGSSSITRWKYERMVERERCDSSSSSSRGTAFVLTHGDLTPRNILVQGSVVTGIVDWERSGFFPAYAEYAFAMALCHSHEKWWLPVLEELLQPCSKQRLKFTRLAEDRGF
jgi:aminoglycoside phosphotransferase